MTIHIGILGGGNISQTHARAAREIDGVTIAAVCGENPAKVAQLAEDYGACAYHRLQAFLKHRPMDVVLIGSPSGRHAEQGIEAARQGLHVLLEKPIAINLEQTDALIAAAEAARVKLGVFFQDRTAPDIARLKRYMEQGGLGRPILASARVKWYRPPDYYRDSRWRGRWALDGGGALMNQGVHTVDLLLWLMGEVRQVWGKTITALHDIEVEDTAIAALEFASGAIGTLEATTSVYPGYARRLELTGSEGTVIIENDRVIAADLRRPPDEFPGAQPARADERSVSPTISDASGHRRVLEDFLQSLATGNQPLCDGLEARRSVALVRAVYQSAQSQKAVSLAASD